MASVKLQSEKIKLPDSLEAIDRLFYGRGWTDGLPIVPPTYERIVRMLGGTHLCPHEVIGEIAPKWGPATVEKIAINCVMAGCLPEYMPVVITAVKGMCRPPPDPDGVPFNLYGMQATTHPAAPLCIVNGPIARRLEMNSGYGVFGPGTRSNAAIGRAIRLILMNIGGGVPGRLDRSTQGQCSKYSFCIAENEDENPWEPLHVERGFSRDASVVTMNGVEGPHNIMDGFCVGGLSMLGALAASFGSMSSNNMIFQAGEPVLCLGPEHASLIAGDGYSKDDVKKFIWENGAVPLERFVPENRRRYEQEPHRYGAPDKKGRVHPVRKWQDIMVIVAGGAGKHSCVLPSREPKSVSLAVQE